jgi:hypothetical protein
MTGAQQEPAVPLSTVAGAENLCQMLILRVSRGQAGNARMRAGQCAGASRLPQHGAHICVAV